MVGYTGGIFSDFFMKRSEFIHKLARWVGLVLVVCTLASVHTETVVPRNFGAANLEKVSRSTVIAELPTSRRSAITSSSQHSSIYDKKQKASPLNTYAVESKVSQSIFYYHIDGHHPAPNWFLVTSRYGKIHSQQYA